MIQRSLKPTSTTSTASRTKILGMSFDDLAVCNRHAYEASFIPEADRKRVWTRYFA